MLNVSEAYKVAIDSVNGRHITAKVKIYFDGDVSAPTIFTNEDTIVHVDLLEEARAETASPLGSIASNELTLQLLNSGDIFNPDNKLGPYYGKLKPGTKVEFLLLLETSLDVYEEITMGLFRTSNWTSPSSTMVASVTCYDRLYELCQLSIPRLPVLRKTTLAIMCTMLFTALGLDPSEYYIDTSLSLPLDYGWFAQGNVRMALQSVVVAGSANISVDRLGIINVYNVLRTSPVAATLSDLDQIITTDVPQAYYQTYSKMKVYYTTPRLGSSTLLLSIKDVVVPTEGLQLTDIAMVNGPVVLIEKIVLNGAKSSRVATLGFSAWGLDLKITNSAAEEIVTIEVYGKSVATVETTYNLADASPIVIQDKTLEVNSPFVQTLSTAKDLANTLLSLARDPTGYVDITCRGNPALEVFDVITVHSPSTNLDELNVIPIRYNYIYDGGLSCTLTSIKQASLEISDWSFVSPGLYVLTARHLFKEV